MSKIVLLILFCVTFAQAQFFWAGAARYAMTTNDGTAYSAKVYLQDSNYPALALHAGVGMYSWTQAGITYTQSGTDYTVGAGQSLNVANASLGIDLNIWAKGPFFIDAAASYIFLNKVTFSDTITDASFPSNAYELELGAGINLGYFTLRPSYSVTFFDSNYLVLGQTMIELEKQTSINLDIVYWW